MVTIPMFWAFRYRHFTIQSKVEGDVETVTFYDPFAFTWHSAKSVHSAKCLIGRKIRKRREAK